jgi:hypothetical protein
MTSRPTRSTRSRRSPNRRSSDPDGSAQVIVTGLQRVKITGFMPDTHTSASRSSRCEIPGGRSSAALLRSVKSLFGDYVENGGSIVPEVAMTAKTRRPVALRDLVAQSRDLTIDSGALLGDGRRRGAAAVPSVFLAKQNEIRDEGEVRATSSRRSTRRSANTSCASR